MKTLSTPLQFSFKPSQVHAASPTHGSAQYIVTALHKKGPLNDVCNYRPISLTLILCKVFETLLYRHLYTHVCDNLSVHQHGFNHGKSSLSNLLETVHEINAILENGEVVDLVY